MTDRLEQWKKRTQVVEFASGMSVEVKMLDILTSGGENGAPNPLLEIMSKTGGKIDTDELAKTDPKLLADLLVTAREACIKAIIDPPIIEAGHEDGISVDEIPITEKIEILMALMGGEDDIQSAKKFLVEQGPSLVVAPDSEGLQAESSDDGGN